MGPAEAFVEASGDGARKAQRLAVGLVVVAAHVVLIWVAQRDAVRLERVIEVTLLSLPITPEDRAREKEARRARAKGSAPESRRAASASTKGGAGAHAKEPSAQSLLQEMPEHELLNQRSLQSEPATGAAPQAPESSIDWQAELQTTAKALEQKARGARERRSFAAPAGTPLTPGKTKPPCPFEKCEPNWGAGFSVFESQSSKKGRIEKTPDQEVIRWTSDHCYQILITPNLLHRGMTKCQMPLGKSAARGDLFKHMKEVPPPGDRATDVP